MASGGSHKRNRFLETIGIIIPFLLMFLVIDARDYFSSLGDGVYIVCGCLFIVGCVAVALEVFSKHTDSAQEMQEKIAEMENVDRLKNDFLSMAQHQLRTPLAGVKWAFEMLRAEPGVPDGVKPLIDDGLERVKDAIGIINQMLKTVEEGDVKLSPENIDLVGMIRAIIAELNLITVKKEVNLTFVCPETLIINADRNKIKAAFINVIDNAIRYSPKGKVEVNLSETPTAVLLVVKDNGIGIDPVDMPFIFERMHRGKNAVMIDADESGVGLYTSKKIFEMHGGKIAVASELNKGTTVTIELPKK